MRKWINDTLKSWQLRAHTLYIHAHIYILCVCTWTPLGGDAPDGTSRGLLRRPGDRLGPVRFLRLAIWLEHTHSVGEADQSGGVGGGGVTPSVNGNLGKWLIRFCSAAAPPPVRPAHPAALRLPSVVGRSLLYSRSLTRCHLPPLPEPTGGFDSSGRHTCTRERSIKLRSSWGRRQQHLSRRIQYELIGKHGPWTTSEQWRSVISAARRPQQKTEQLHCLHLCSETGRYKSHHFDAVPCKTQWRLQNRAGAD